jgi:cell division protein FtsA
MVRCVVGIVDPNNPGKVSIIGSGSSSNFGMRRGVVVHVEDAAEAIVQAITETERLSGIRIHGATVNINGAHIGGMNSKGVIAISAANREITRQDRMRVEEAATIVQLPSNREIIQMFAKSYRLDGQENIKDPVGMHGVRLEVDTHIVTAATPTVRSLDMALEKAQVAQHHRALSSLAAAEAVLERQQKEAGTVLLDIGAGTTNIVVFEDGEVQHVAVLPIGGMHITNDLAIGLKTDLDVAEAVKVQHANLDGKATKKDFRVKVSDQEHIFQTEDVVIITEARMEELLEYVQKELVRIHKAQKLPGGVVLVGGTAKLPGIAGFTKDKLQLAARVGRLQGVSGLLDTVADPSYATAVGLMLLDVLLPPEAQQITAGQAGARALKLVNSLLSRFKN